MSIVSKTKLIFENFGPPIGGSEYNEAYDKNIVDDPAFEKESVYVPLKRKKEIKDFLKSIGL